MKERVGDTAPEISAYLCPCPYNKCIYFGMSDIIFKQKKENGAYDIIRNEDKSVDWSIEAWTMREPTAPLSLSLARHYIFNLDLGNKGVLESHRRGHLDNFPACLKYYCKHSGNKTYKKLNNLLPDNFLD